jgi:hypothetical protein
MAGDVETLVDRLERLNRERQALRDEHTDNEALERNRREIVAAQWELSRALIERYRPMQTVAQTVDVR